MKIHLKKLYGLFVLATLLLVGNLVQAQTCPFAKSDHATTLTEVPVSLYPMSNDDVGPNPYIGIITGPFNGSLTYVGLDSIVYVSNPGFTGIDFYIYYVCDTSPLGCGCDTAQGIITVLGCYPPIALNDNADVRPGTVGSIDVSANDSLYGNPVVSLAIVNGPNKGTASVVGNNIEYTADSGYIGGDTIRYVICTDCACDTAYLYINNCVNPVATDDAFLVGNAATCTATLDVLANDIAVGTTATIINGPNHGTAMFDMGMLVYTPDGTLTGGQRDTVWYSLCNGCGCDTAMVVLTASPYACNLNAPTADTLYVSICNEDTLMFNFSSAISDVDGDSLWISAVGAAPNGSASLVDPMTGQYVANTGFIGTDMFTYTVTDNGDPNRSSMSYVVVDVRNCINPPYVVDEDGNPTDTVEITLYEMSDSIICFPLVDDDGDDIAISGILDGPWTNGDIINAADSCLEFVSDTIGDDILRVIHCDERGYCDTFYLIIHVIPAMHPPIANPDVVIVDGHNTTTVYPLNNDVDPDGDGLNVAGIYYPGSGTAGLNPDNTVSYTPDSAFSGNDTIYYVACNATGCDTSVIIMVVSVVANNDAAETPANTPVTIPLQGNDITNDNTTYSLCSQPANGTATIVGTSAVYTPNDGFTGTDIFCYVICDAVTGLCDTALVTVVVRPGEIVVPSGISPNGDSYNEFLVIPGILDFPNSVLTIYNRWGDKVWQNGDGGYQNNWNGVNKNDKGLPDGTYYYVLELNDDNYENKAGFITLNR